MTKSDYLKMAGYSEADWTVMEPDTAKKYLKEKGAVSWMYPIKDKKAMEELGKGFYLVKKSWLERIAKEIPATEATEELQKAVEVIDEKIPLVEIPKPPITAKVIPEVPDISGIQIPDPPDKISEAINDVVEDVAEDIVHIENNNEAKPLQNFYCKDYLEGGKFCEKQCDVCIEEEAKVANQEEKGLEHVIDETSEKRHVMLENNGFTYNEKHDIYQHECGVNTPKVYIMDMSDEGFEAAVVDLNKAVEIRLKPKKDVIVEKVVETNGLSIIETDVKAEDETPVEIKSEPGQNIENKAVDIVEEVKDEVVKELKITAKTLSKITALKKIGWIDVPGKSIGCHAGVNKDKVFTYEELQKVSDKDFKILTKKTPIEEPVKKVVKPKKKIENVPTAPEDIAKQFAFLDEVVETAIVFKNTFYAISAIREALASDLTPAKKLVLIENAVNNI